MLNALIFDVDGTLADTESAHRIAFNQAFAKVGFDWAWDEPTYKKLLQVTGGKERILHYWQQVETNIMQIEGSSVQDTIERIHVLKTVAYVRAVQQGAVQLRPGVLRLIEAAYHDGLRLGIATTTSPINVTAMLRATMGPDWSHYFEVIEDASTAPLKKPDPQVYLQTLARLHLPATECLVIEDSLPGLTAAVNAGLPTIVTPNAFTADQDFTAALRILPDLQGTTVADLRAWHARALTRRTTSVASCLA